MLTAQGVAYGEALVASKDERGWEEGVGHSKLNQNALASEVGLMTTPCGDWRGFSLRDRGSQQPGVKPREGGADHWPSAIGKHPAQLQGLLSWRQRTQCTHPSLIGGRDGNVPTLSICVPAASECALMLCECAGPLFSRGK